MRGKSLQELKENFEELALRISELLNIKVVVRGLDMDSFLKEDLDFVTLDKFRDVQGKLFAHGLLETACKNFVNFTEEIDGIKPKLANNIEKILMGITQLEILIDKGEIKVKPMKKAVPPKEKTEPPIQETPPQDSGNAEGSEDAEENPNDKIDEEIKEIQNKINKLNGDEPEDNDEDDEDDEEAEFEDFEK